MHLQESLRKEIGTLASEMVSSIGIDAAHDIEPSKITLLALICLTETGNLLQRMEEFDITGKTPAAYGKDIPGETPAAHAKREIYDNRSMQLINLNDEIKLLSKEFHTNNLPALYNTINKIKVLIEKIDPSLYKESFDVSYQVDLDKKVKQEVEVGTKQEVELEKKNKQSKNARKKKVAGHLESLSLKISMLESKKISKLKPEDEGYKPPSEQLKQLKAKKEEISNYIEHGGEIPIYNPKDIKGL